MTLPVAPLSELSKIGPAYGSTDPVPTPSIAAATHQAFAELADTNSVAPPAEARAPVGRYTTAMPASVPGARVAASSTRPVTSASSSADDGPPASGVPPPDPPSLPPSPSSGLPPSPSPSSSP